MNWFFQKQMVTNPLLRSIELEIKSRALAAIESRRIQIIHLALFDSDDALIELADKSHRVVHKLKSISEQKLNELLERGLRETAWDSSSDGTTELLRTLINESSQKISLGCPLWLDKDEDRRRNRYLWDQFEEFTTLALLIQKFYSLNEHIAFSNPSYFKKEHDSLKDFRLRTLVGSCMNLGDLKGGGRFSGCGFDDAAFKATRVHSFIESCWHISIKRFGEFAIHKTMLDDNNITLSRTYRSDENFSQEIPLSLGS